MEMKKGKTKNNYQVMCLNSTTVIFIKSKWSKHPSVNRDYQFG